MTQDLSRINPLNDPTTKKLAIENNPMFKQKPIEVVFPRIKTERTKKSVKGLKNQETLKEGVPRS